MVAHKGQLRKDGEAYWKHPFRVACSFMPNTDEAVVAFLHDVLEDTKVSLEALCEEGLTPTQEVMLLALTKKAGEKYFDYIARVKNCAGAIPVKLADLEDNMPGAPRGMKERYEKSWEVLTGKKREV